MYKGDLPVCMVLILRQVNDEFWHRLNLSLMDYNRVLAYPNFETFQYLKNSDCIVQHTKNKNQVLVIGKQHNMVHCVQCLFMFVCEMFLMSLKGKVNSKQIETFLCEKKRLTTCDCQSQARCLFVIV